MPNHRDRGYALMHKLFLLVFVFSWFWFVVFWESGDPLINLPWNYALVAAAGLVVALWVRCKITDLSSSRADGEGFVNRS